VSSEKFGVIVTSSFSAKNSISEGSIIFKLHQIIIVISFYILNIMNIHIYLQFTKKNKTFYMICGGQNYLKIAGVLLTCYTVVVINQLLFSIR
jgi:hypothetical protein